MARKLRWGILSTATINDVVIDALRKASRSEPAAVASRDPGRAKRYASERGIRKAYGSYVELLSDPDIDAVYVSVPNALHGEWAVKAAEARKHVLCEKPIVTNMEDFARVESAAKRNCVVLFEAFMYLHHPQTLKVKELVRSGRLGRLLFIDSWFDYYLPREDTGNIRLDRELQGGSLWDVGTYPNSLSVTMAASKAPVQVFAVTAGDGADVDLRAYGHLTFADGLFAHFSASMRSPFRVGAHIVGEKGWINVDNPWKPGLDGRETRIVFAPSCGEEEVHRFPGVSPYLAEVEAMEACVLDGTEPLVPLALSREFLRSMLALRESARAGKAVTVK
jgi:xylose dehydrogenase (NAD/NADP)